MSLNEKAKTFKELHGKGCAYDCELREKCSPGKPCVSLWVRLEDANEQTSKAIELGLKALLELKEIYERERGEQKQKLIQTYDEICAKLKFLDYEQYHGDLKQSLNPTLREINKLLGDLLK